MKGLFPKVHLEWKEPESIRRVRDDLEKKEVSPWTNPGFVLLICAVAMTQWWVASQTPGKTPIDLWAALAIALLGGACMVYGIPWILSLCPSSIRIMDNGISRVIGNHASFWKFKDIEQCEFASLDGGEIQQPVFVIHTNKAKRIVLGIPAELSSPARQVLSDMNVKTNVVSQGPLAHLAQASIGDESAK